MILSFTLFFILCLCAYTEASGDYQHNVKIIGGEAVNITEVPYQLAVELVRGKFVCGASIIHRSWALSAAHCVYGYPESKIRLRSGSSYRLKGGTLHLAKRIIIHPNYNPTNYDYDVSVIEVFTPFRFSDVAQRILLTRKTPSVGTPAVASGWGRLSPGGVKPKQLHKVTVYIANHNICKHNYGFLSRRMLCAGDPRGGKDTCQGDSGGPLVVGNKQVGIVPWGQPCGNKFFPGVYTDVSRVRKWIISYIWKTSHYR